MKFLRLCLCESAGTCVICEKPIVPGQGYLSPTGDAGKDNLAHEECVEKYSKQPKTQLEAEVGGHHEITDEKYNTDLYRSCTAMGLRH